MSKSGKDKKTAKAASVETAKAAIETAKAAKIPTMEGLRQMDKNPEESVSINDRQKKKSYHQVEKRKSWWAGFSRRRRSGDWT